MVRLVVVGGDPSRISALAKEGITDKVGDYWWTTEPVGEMHLWGHSFNFLLLLFIAIIVLLILLDVLSSSLSM